MTRDGFRELFEKALDEASVLAERKLGAQIPRSYLIELHGAGCAGQRIEFEQALDRIYLGDDRFHKVIDVAIIALASQWSVAFVRVSGHPPVKYEETWDTDEMGPFKQIGPATIEVDRSGH